MAGMWRDLIIAGSLQLTLQVVITLTETETIWMLDIPGTCVALDSEEAEEVKAKNEKYQEVTYE